jgi:hypothetical protein
MAKMKIYSCLFFYIFLFSSFVSFSQKENNSSLSFNHPSYPPEGFSEYLLDSITVDKRTKSSTLFILFKINSKSEISEFKLSGEMSSKIKDDFKNAILKSQPFWKSNFQDPEYKWVVLPVFLENPTSTLPSKTKFDGNAFFSKMEMQFEWLRKNVGSNLSDVYFSAPFIRKN